MTPHRIVSVVEGRVSAGAEVSDLVEAARSLVGERAVHLWSYVERGGGALVGIFDGGVPAERSGDGLTAWPAAVRTRRGR